jgi:uncharacterized membrane protein
LLAVLAERAGIERLLLARVVENEEQLAIVERAVPGARVEVFRLVLATAIFVFMWMKIQQQRKLGFIIALALIFAGFGFYNFRRTRSYQEEGKVF